MPRVRRENLPRALWAHLLGRMHQREISLQQLYLLSKWLENEPEVPNGPWFKRFPEMTVCGEGELVKTFLTAAQTPVGQGASVDSWERKWRPRKILKRSGMCGTQAR